MDLTSRIEKEAQIDMFIEGRNEETFVGRPFYLDYDKALILISDSKKFKVGGIPQGAFLLAFYDNEEGVSEALLLRALKTTKLPTDNDVISSMIEYYKDNIKTSGKDSELDDFTRYEFSFSGLECRILGSFYRNEKGLIVFGADVENFYSAHNYKVYKPKGKILEFIVNCNDKGIIDGEIYKKIGKVRYSSTKRFQEKDEEVPVYILPKDFLGKRTALFGMTRTGKSNTVKKIIQQTVEMSNLASSSLKKVEKLKKEGKIDTKFVLENFTEDGKPRYPVGQIIFDINGEYANANLQDEGTAIFELYKDNVLRYSVIEKEGFKVMKINFYEQITAGFNLIENHFRNIGETADYVNAFRVINLEKPDDYEFDQSVSTRYDRKKAAYLCCLYKAGFPVNRDFKVKFKGFGELNEFIGIDPDKGISLQEATNWFTQLWEKYNEISYTRDYPKKNKGKEWADEELKALLVFLTMKKQPGANVTISGYKKLTPLIKLHTQSSDKPFEDEILNHLREGKIVIVDLSQGDPEIQKLYSEQICKKIFDDSMSRFTKNHPNNFIQFYFEEAHNLFPKKEDKDLSQIYNRIAKEGAKLNLGMIYATQEVSSISSNILKNTQNWFISHLNNEDETKELKKYYDFGDFVDSLVKFSATSDKGFVRMKTYSNSFVVPVQIDKFSVKGD
ncbi:ATP-binding protein [Anoxybacillus ayderensis]|uniref:ATP-binding protein n=1 Tax=Anoxybacillus ayderensis TaxID=265546 RepID=UPI000A26E83E|nr:DUF87 domain-containing protein [Anoxybacillus ayderensis]MED0657118.1 DUF87 domain-containing protein [Anoxybacillus ayderensis]OSX55444.1 ATPase [Anoxybacillus ayderensis]